MVLDFSVVLLDIVGYRKFEETMSFFSLLSGSQAAIGSAGPLPWIAMIPVEWQERIIQALPALGLFVFGLIVGTFFFRKRESKKAEKNSSKPEPAPTPEVPPPVASSEADAGSVESSETESTPVEAIGRLEGELSAERSESERRGREIETLSADLADARQELQELREQGKRLKEEAASRDKAEKEENAPPPSKPDDSPKLAEEIQTLRFAAAARDGEIARLKAQVARRDSQLDSLRKEMASAAATNASDLGPTNPIASRLGSPVPAGEARAGRRDRGPGGRRFIRRLLGIGDSGGAFPNEAAEGIAVSIPAASLREARSALSELKKVPPPEKRAIPVLVNGDDHHSPASEEGEESEELVELRRQLEERDSRIAELEAKLSLRDSDGEESIPTSLDSLPLVSISEDSNDPFDSSDPGGHVIGKGDELPITDSEYVLFRGRNPHLWNTQTPEGEGDLARPLEACPEGVDFLRICRLDTGESVVYRITRKELLDGGSAKATRGWSGRGEEYFGAYHLGLFDASLPRDVETKFGFGGWGFGHRESIGSGQAFGWAGHFIEDPGDGFAISVGVLPPGFEIEEAVVSSEPKSRDEKSESVTAETVAAALAASTDPELPAVEPPVGEPFLVEKVEAPENPDSEPAPEPVESSSPREPDLVALTRKADKRTGGLILFRSNDPSLWNTDTFLGANRRSRSLEVLPEGLSFLRLRRIDTGEGVVLPISNESLLDDADGQPRGFNGTNESFYGAHHLGVFDESLPQEVETRFTYGGWGFGHSVMGTEEQASGWEGRRIPSDTVFEIAVFRRMPVLGERDRMID